MGHIVTIGLLELKEISAHGDSRHVHMMIHESSFPLYSKERGLKVIHLRQLCATSPHCILYIQIYINITCLLQFLCSRQTGDRGMHFGLSSLR
jgi:hypothetical protein